MEKIRFFCLQKFRAFLFAGFFAAFADWFLRIAESVVLGHWIGEDAMAGVSLLFPLLAIVTFVATTVALGTAIHYSISLGRVEKDRAGAFLAQGLVLALVGGLLLSGVVGLAERWYLPLMDGSEYVEMYALQYLRFAAPIALLECVRVFLVALSFSDGASRLCVTSHVVLTVVFFGASIWGVESGLGAGGVSLGVVVSEIAATLVLIPRFFRTSSSISLKFSVSFRDFLDIVRSGASRVSILLFDAAVFFFLMKLVIGRFGSDDLPVLSVVMVLWGFFSSFGGVGLALQPLVPSYWGEGNTRAIRVLVRHAIRTALVAGCGLAVVGMLLPDIFIWLTGVEYPELVELSRRAVRLVCLAAVPLALIHLFSYYFVFIQQAAVTLGLLLANVLFLWLFSVVGSWIGLDGLWLGLALAPVAALASVSTWILAARGRGAYPCLLPRQHEANVFVFNLTLDEREIVETSRLVAECVSLRLPPSPETASVANRASLMVEEGFLLVKERNPASRRILGEATLDLTDGVRLTLRDDGRLFDLTDVDQKVSSLRAYLVASVMGEHPVRVNLVSAGFNRNVFKLA